MGCPLCDNLGAIDDPLRSGCLKKCPECDTETDPILLIPLTELLFGPDGPDPGEREYYEELERRRLERVRAEEADYMRRHLAGFIPGDLPEGTCPMTASEALIYCLGFVDYDNPTDGEYQSQTAYDRYGDPHWVAWRVADGADAIPRLCSGSPAPFARALQPYRLFRSPTGA